MSDIPESLPFHPFNMAPKLSVRNGLWIIYEDNSAMFMHEGEYRYLSPEGMRAIAAGE